MIKMSNKDKIKNYFFQVLNQVFQIESNQMKAFKTQFTLV